MGPKTFPNIQNWLDLPTEFFFNHFIRNQIISLPIKCCPIVHITFLLKKCKPEG